jgi:hypothetical protein
MNFISHFYFFKKGQDPYYNCGLIFPDWLAAYNKTKFQLQILTQNTNEERLEAGIQNHLLGDKMFHGSDYFREQTHGIKLLLEKSTLDKDQFRFSFLAHIILEMMIDRLLLLKDPNIGTSFYDNLDSCDDNLLLYFALRNSRVDEGFLTLIQKFKRHRFILQYIKTDVFVYSLNRSIGRVGLNLNDDQGREMMELLDTIEAYVNDNIQGLFSLFNIHEK